MAACGIWLELGLVLLTERGWPPRLSTDGGQARCVFPVLAVKLGTVRVALLLRLPRRHGSSFLPDNDMGKLDEPTGPRARSAITI